MFQRIVLRLVMPAALLLIAQAARSQEVQVDRDELASIGDRSVQFINYVGPYEFTNTLDQIRDIGRALGARIDVRRSGEASVGGKYRVLHIVAPEIPEGLDADIFILDPDAAVDHIANLRTILAGYLETAYGFTTRDAYLLAEFATYYNAVHRGDSPMVQERYKEPVGRALSPVNIGLDTHYSNWPGKTEMLIPLRGALTGEGPPRIDTGAISEPAVVDRMREENDMGIESRRGMVELREKELDEEQAALDERREETERRAAEITREIEELSDGEEQSPPDSPASPSSSSPPSGDSPSRPEKDERAQELRAEKKAVEREQAAVERRQREIDERTEDVMRMRDDIAEDENTIIKRAETPPEDTFTSAEPVTPVWFLTVDNEGGGIPFGRVVKYNLEDGERLAVSEITAVRGRTLVLLPDSLLVIAGKNDGGSRVRPMLLDRDSLETRREGTHDIFPGSLITVQGSDIYLVTTEGGQWRLGKFNANLERKAVSEAVIEPFSSVSFDGASLFVQSSGGEIIKLSSSSLREEDRLE